MVYEKLYDWQRKLVDNIKDEQTYGLFLDMGLGKTPISIALTEVNHVEKLLIITINSKAEEKKDVHGSWLDWVSQSDMNYTLLTKNIKNLEFDPDRNECFLTNYEFLFAREKSPDERRDKKNKAVKVRDILREFIQSCQGKRTAILIDESHKMKESKASQTKVINQIYARLKIIASSCYLYLLTGTPFTKGYIDLYTQLKILGAKINKQQFKDQFCVIGKVPGLMQWQQPIVGYQNVDRLFDLIHQHAITINSKDVISLPEQVFNYITYPMTNPFKFYLFEKRYGIEIKKELEKRGEECHFAKSDLQTKQLNPFYRNIAYPEFKWSAETPGEFWLRARELSIGFQGNATEYKFYDKTRFKLLEEFLKKNEDNYLLFYSYTPELFEIFEICERLGYDIDIYSGDIKSLENYKSWAQLSPEQKLVEPRKRVLLSNWASGSTGMNFQEYSKCIIFDLPVFKDWQQGVKRIHRTGQTNTCIYYVFMQECFLDKGMMNAIKLQQDYTKDTFESDLENVNKLFEDSI